MPYLYFMEKNEMFNPDYTLANTTSDEEADVSLSGSFAEAE